MPKWWKFVSDTDMYQHFSNVRPLPQHFDWAIKASNGSPRRTPLGFFSFGPGAWREISQAGEMRIMR